MQSSLRVKNLPNELWWLIALEVSNWKSFILACKLFSLFNTEELKLLKYCKVRSFRNRYPKITSIRPGKHVFHNIFKRLPNYEAFYKEQNSKERCWRDTCYQRVNTIRGLKSVWDAYGVILSSTYNGTLCPNCIKDCAKILALRDDLTYEMALKIIYKKKIGMGFYHQVCSNSKLTLDEVIRLGKVINMHSVYGTITRRPDVTFEVIEAYPDMQWDYNHVLGCKKVSVDNIEKTLFAQRYLGCYPTLETNYNLTWEELRHFRRNPHVNHAVTFLVHKEATYERILENLEEVLTRGGFYSEVLLNPTLTFEEVDTLFKIKLGFASI